MSPKDKLATILSPEKPWSTKESWRLFEIMAEFVEGTERLDATQPAVSIFGNARTQPDHPHYRLAEQIARQLSDFQIKCAYCILICQEPTCNK